MKINEFFRRHFGAVKGLEQIQGLADHMDRFFQEQSRNPIYDPAMAEAIARRMDERQVVLDRLRTEYATKVSESYAH